MENGNTPVSLEEQIQWLVDRAQISDLLNSFAAALDSKNVSAYVNNYTDDGVLVLPNPASPKESIEVKRDVMKDFVSKGLMEAYSATHHISSNHQISIDGDLATSRSYLQAVHVRKHPLDHWDVGGWYDCRYVRTAEGWKFKQVKLSAVWLSGEPGSIEPES